MNSLSVFCACWILRRGERERGHDIRLRSLREFLKVRFDYPITVLAWHALKPPIDYANPNGGRVVAISIDLLQDRPPENVIDQTSLISALGFPSRYNGFRHDIWGTETGTQLGLIRVALLMFSPSGLAQAAPVQNFGVLFRRMHCRIRQRRKERAILSVPMQFVCYLRG